MKLSIEPAPSAETSDPQSDESPTTAVRAPAINLPSTQLRIKLFLTGVVFPIACFIASARGMEVSVDRPWQSGEIQDYLAMLLAWPGFLPTLPLVVFSIGCMAAWIIQPRLSHRRWIRMGLYGGVVLATQFLLCVIVTTQIMTIFAAVIAIPGLALAVFLASKSGPWIKRFTIRHLLILTTVVALAIVFLMATKIINSWVDLVMWVFVVGFFVIVAAPTLNWITFARVSVRAYLIHQAAENQTNPNQNKLSDLPGIAIIVTWVLAWLASWKLAVDIMLVEYSKLPTTNPNCYVSSAAANGHPRLVRSKPRGSGRVNLQMQRLKFLEFALAAAMPRLHACIRNVYNFVGPGLARVCKANVWFADATYLLLKPLEWTAQRLRSAAGISRSRIHRIYRR